jgi:hypothetical protein
VPIVNSELDENMEFAHLEIDPQLVAARSFLAWMLVRRAEALERAEAAYAIAPTYPNVDGGASGHTQAQRAA